MTTTDFFSRFPGFEADPTVPLLVDFERLAVSRHWIAGSKTYARHRRVCLTQEFEKCYGQDGTKLASWQALCIDLRVEPVPTSITKCRKVNEYNSRVFENVYTDSGS